MDKADIAFSQFIRLRDRECKRCGLPVQFNSKGLPISHHASHFQVRRKEATRFDESNVDTMCESCHRLLEDHPTIHRAWQIANKGEEKVNEIILKSNGYKKKDRDAEYVYWSKRLKELLV
jgi:5-methylcytosine-specific restriction endonuclease McrA